MYADNVTQTLPYYEPDTPEYEVSVEFNTVVSSQQTSTSSNPGNVDKIEKNNRIEKLLAP